MSMRAFGNSVLLRLVIDTGSFGTDLIKPIGKLKTFSGMADLPCCVLTRSVHLLACVLTSTILLDASETFRVLCERLGATDDDGVPDAAILPAIEAAAPVPIVDATQALLPQLSRGL